MNSYDLLDSDFWSGDTPEAIDIPLVSEGKGSAALFLGDRPLNKQDEQWLKSAASAIRKDPEAQKTIAATAPTRTALTALDNAINKFSGPMPGTREGWQNFVMSKYFELANDIDPKVSKPALDSLARTTAVGLHEERVEVSLEVKSNVDLQVETLDLLRRLAARSEEKVING